VAWNELCAACGEKNTNDIVFCDNCKDNRPRHLSLPRWKAFLLRMKERINSEGKATGYDDNTIGNKNTECRWGACDQAEDMWPDAEDHIWPHKFKTLKRIAPLDVPNALSQWCPLDRRAGQTYDESNIDHLQGCFYSCRFFQPEKGDELPKERVLGLYDKAIARVDKALKKN
jgi:hypothetical protein